MYTHTLLCVQYTYNIVTKEDHQTTKAHSKVKPFNLFTTSDVFIKISTTTTKNLTENVNNVTYIYILKEYNFM